MHQPKMTTDIRPPAEGIEQGQGESPAYRDFLKKLIGKEGVLWQGAFTGSGITMEIRYCVHSWSTKKHHRLVRIVEVHQDFLILDEHLPDLKESHTRYMIPLQNIIISENIGQTKI